MENKTIDTNIRIMRNTKFLNEPLLVTQSTQRRHKPTIAISSLSHIISSGTVDVEFWLVKNIHHPLRALRFELASRGLVVLDVDVVERLQTVADVELEIGFDVEVRVSVLFVDPAAFFDDFGDFGAAHSRCVVVGSLGCCWWALLGVSPGDSVGVGVLRDHGGSCVV